MATVDSSAAQTSSLWNATMNLKWAILVSISTSATLATTTCYDPTGNVQSNLVPCDPTATISMCCLAADYCLSNTLCFNGFGNNLLANKGCTDPNWGSPCVNYCKAVGFGQNLFPCTNTEQTNGTIGYACGSDSACSTAASVLSVPVGTVVLRADQIATLTGSSASTTLTASTTNSISTAPATASATPSSSHSNSQALGLGLGIGIPFGLTLIGTLVFLTRELHRYNNNRGSPSPAIPVLGYTELESVRNSDKSLALKVDNSVGRNELPGN